MAPLRRILKHNQTVLPVACILAACFAAGSDQAQTAAATSPAPPPTQITPFTTSSDAEEVTLDLLARDDHGRPVLDLDADQIRVTDDGKPVKVSNLRLVKGEAAGHKVTLLYGRLDAAGDKNARDVTAKILKTLPSGFSYSVMNVGSRLRLLQPFTTDAALIQHGISAATIEDKPNTPGPNEGPEKNLITAVQTGLDSSGVPIPAADRVLDKVLYSSMEESQRLAQDLFTQASLASLLALSKAEREIPGRKVIVYFTEGFQMDSNAMDMIHNIVGAANRSGVTIYTIDLSALDAGASNGLMATMAMGAQGPSLSAAASAAAHPVEGATGQAVGAGTFTSAAEQSSRIEYGGGGGTPLGMLAGGTGGGYMAGGDSLKKPLKRMVDDLTTYYEATFVPQVGDYDGRFRPLQVASLRKNVFVRGPAGYYALAPGSSSTVRPFEAPLLKILAGADLPTDLAFHAGIIRMGPLQEGNTSTVVVETPLDQIDVHEDQNTRLYSLHVSIVAEIKNKAGEVMEHFSEDIPRHGAIESLQASHGDVITMQRHFVAPPGEYTLEAAVLDNNSNKTGAQRIKFAIPEPPKGLALSDVTLVRRTDLFRKESDPGEPLRYGKSKVVPNLSGEVIRDAKDISVFFIIHPDANKDPVKLDMEVLKDGKSIGKIPLPVRSDIGPGVAVPYLGTIQAKSLSSGHYEVAAVLTQGSEIVRHDAWFTIVGGEVASASVPRPGQAPGKPNDEADSVSDSLPQIGAREASKLVITTPTEAYPPPTPEAIATMLAGARARALHYSESLPNFSCVEVTTRSIDSSGKGTFKHKDEMAQLLKYRDQAETRTMLEVDGKKSSVEPEDLKGMSSRGQFGGVLNAVFDPSAKADFEWKETDALGGGPVQVFSYKVAQEHSNYGLTGRGNDAINVAFHGLIYIDANTLGVRRITLEADDTPKNFYIHKSLIAVDYEYIVINGHDYLMPVHAAISVRQGKHEGVLNELQFRDYRRFGSRVRILGAAQPPKP